MDVGRFLRKLFNIFLFGPNKLHTVPHTTTDGRLIEFINFMHNTVYKTHSLSMYVIIVVDENI